MQTEKSRLIIHASGIPENKEASPKESGAKRLWQAFAALRRGRAQSAGGRVRTPRARKARTPGERLLRNTAVACALMMAFMTVRAIDQPWSNRIAQTVSGAVTMKIDLDETLGKLNFVREWMPDTALVFWNMGARDALARPVAGALTHPYAAEQPYLIWQVDRQQPVYAALDGTVAALTENEKGEWTMLIDHEGGEQTVYAYMDRAIVRTGQAVARGAQIGLTKDESASRLYFELRREGAPADPSPRLS